MKKHYSFIVSLFAAVMLTSCSSKVYNYVQVFETKTYDDVAYKNHKDGLLYEDENCAVYHSFWADGGDASFEFYNKTNKIIYLDKSKTFFIRNGIANDYYVDRSWGSSSSNSMAAQNTTSYTYYHADRYDRSSGLGASYAGIYNGGHDAVSASAAAKVGKSVFNGNIYSTSQTNYAAVSKTSSLSVRDNQIEAIPPKSSKIISEYAINKTLYLNCDLPRYPNDKVSVTFTKENSPLVFENYITYNFGEGTPDKVIENKFYVSSITNYAKPSVTNYVERETPCKNITDDDGSGYYTGKTYAKIYDMYWTLNTNNGFYLTYNRATTRTLYKEKNNYYYNYSYNGYLKGGN